MFHPPPGAFQHYDTSLPWPYLYVIWDGPPGNVILTPGYKGELSIIDLPPGHKALREDVGNPPPLEKYKTPRASVPFGQPTTRPAPRDMSSRGRGAPGRGRAGRQAKSTGGRGGRDRAAVPPLDTGLLDSAWTTSEGDMQAPKRPFGGSTASGELQFTARPTQVRDQPIPAVSLTTPPPSGRSRRRKTHETLGPNRRDEMATKV